MKNRLVVGIVVVMLWAIGVSAQAWSPPEIVGDIVDHVTVGPDSCIPESVTFTGDFTFEVTKMTDTAGQQHVRSMVPHYNVGAVASSGASYQMLMFTKEVDTISEAEVGIETTQIWRLKILGDGPLNNETFYMTVHFSNPNPNSQGTGADVEHFSTKCNGK